MATKFLRRAIRKLLRTFGGSEVFANKKTARRLSSKSFSNGVVFRKCPKGLVLLGEASKSDAYVISEIFDKDLYYFEDICSLLPNVNLAIDIGAHKGYFSSLAAKTFSKVVSYEASAKNYDFLIENIRSNGLSNVNAKLMAVSSVDGEVKFNISSRTGARNTMIPNRFAGNTTETTVPSATLKSVLGEEKTHRCSVLKVDVEGAEYSIFSACPDGDIKRFDVVLLEVHESFENKGEISKLLSRLSNLGFDLGVTSDKLLADEFYTAMITAFNKEEIPQEKRNEFWRKHRRFPLDPDFEYQSYERQLFKAFNFVEKSVEAFDVNLADVLVPETSKTISNVSAREKTKRLNLIAAKIEVIFYWSAVWNASQVRYWKNYIANLPYKTAVLSNRRGKKVVKSLVTNDILFEEDGYTAEFIATLPNIQAVFHPRAGLKNQVFLNRPNIMNGFVGHGDSGKLSSTAHSHSFYDKVYVAGNTGAKRYKDSKSRVTDEAISLIAPAVDPRIEVGGRRTQVKTLLYAPTWEGYSDEANYSSILYMTPVIEDLLTQNAELTFLFLPHPGLGTRCAKTRAARDTLSKLCRGNSQDLREKYEKFNSSDAMLTDVSGVQTEYLFTEKPIFLGLAPHGKKLRFKQSETLQNYVTPIEANVKSLADALSSADLDPQLLGLRKSMKSDKYVGCETFDDTLKEFSRTVQADISEFQESTRILNVSNLDKSEFGTVVKLASDLCHDAQELLFSGEFSNNGGGSSIGNIWIKSPFGLANPDYFEGKMLEVVSIFGESEAASTLEVGGQYSALDVTFFSDKDKYSMKLRSNRTGDIFKGQIEANSVVLEVVSEVSAHEAS